MSIPLFFPAVHYVPRLKRTATVMTLRALCDQAGVACKASGAWTDRVIMLSASNALRIVAEPGDGSAVLIAVMRSAYQGAPGVGGDGLCDSRPRGQTEHPG